MATTINNDLAKRRAYWYRVDNPKTKPGDWLLASKSVVEVNSRTGVPNRFWRSQVSKHQSATTGLTGVRTTHQSRSAGGMLEMKGTTGLVARIAGDLAGMRDNEDPGDSHMNTVTARQQATTRFNKVLARSQRQMQGAVFLGEGREALHMLRGATIQLYKHIRGDYLYALRDLRKSIAYGRIKKPTRAQLQKRISSTWLEACFGWSPFVSDIQDAVKAWKKLAEKEPDVLPVWGRSEQSEMFLQMPIMTRLAPVSNFQCIENGSYINRVNVRVDGAAIAKSQAVTPRWQTLFGLSADQFMPTVWELLPWSFLFDYFSNIGDIIEIGCSGSASLAWSKTVVINARIRSYAVWHDATEQARIGAGNLDHSGGGPWTSYWNKRSVSRSPGIDSTIPELSFEIPGSPMQFANMTALFAQANESVGPQIVRPIKLWVGKLARMGK